MTDTQQVIIQELQHASEETLEEILKLLKIRNAQEKAEDEEDIADFQAALEEAKIAGTVPWSEVKKELGL
jgi:N-acetylglutamate synthase-like GNAT family acetyltransferase